MGDVVLQSSPLYEYLKSVGEAEDYDTGNDIGPMHPADSTQDDGPPVSAPDVPAYCPSTFEKLLSYFQQQGHGYPCTFHQLQRVLSSVYDCQYVLEEDAETIIDTVEYLHVDPQFVQTANAINERTGQSDWRDYLPYSIVGAAAVGAIGSLSSFGGGRRMGVGVGVAAAVLTGVGLRMSLPTCSEDRELAARTRHCIGDVERVLRVTSSVLRLLAKAITEVQQAEAVAMGYAMDGPLPPVSRLEQSLHRRQHQDWRHTIHTSIQQTITTYRHAALHLLTIPGVQDVDTQPNCCDLPVNELGLDESSSGEKRDSDCDQSLSVGALRDMRHVCLLAVSHCLRRLALAMVGAMAQCAVEEKEEPDALMRRTPHVCAHTLVKVLPAWTSSLLKNIHPLCVSLQFLLDSARSIEPPRPPPTLPCDFNLPSWWGVVTACQSLDSTLYAGLMRVRECQQELESLRASQQSGGQNYSGIKARLDGVRADLMLATRTLVDAQHALDPLLPSSLSPPNTNSETLQDDGQTQNEDEPTPTVTVGVFEGTAEEQEDEFEKRRRELKTLSREERIMLQRARREEEEKEKRKKEEPLLLMSELKSVLHGRSVDP